APFSFVKRRAERFPPLSNSILVDHTTDLRLFAPQRNPQDPSQSAAGPNIAIQLFFEVSLPHAACVAARAIPSTSRRNASAVCAQRSGATAAGWKPPPGIVTSREFGIRLCHGVTSASGR